MKLIFGVWRVGFALLINHTDVNMDAHVYFQFTASYGWRYYGLLWMRSGIAKMMDMPATFQWVHP